MSALEVETPVLSAPFRKYSLWLSASPFSRVARWLRAADLLRRGDPMLPHCVPAVFSLLQGDDLDFALMLKGQHHLDI